MVCASRQLSTITNNKNMECMNNAAQTDCQKRIQEISMEVKIWACNSILHKDLNMHYLCQHLVQKMSTPKHKETWLALGGYLTTVANRYVTYSLFPLINCLKGHWFLSTKEVTSKSMTEPTEVSKMLSRNSSKSFMNIGISVSLPKEITMGKNVV
jgi:hypothetical protein